MRLTVKSEEEYERACRHLLDVWRRERERAGISVEVLPFVEPMTPKQRGKLFAILDELADMSGNEPVYLRADFEKHYGPSVDGKSGPLPKPMSQYTKAEATAMIERVIQVAAEQGYTLR